MEMNFVDWLKDKEAFLNDEIENNRPGFNHIDIQLLGGVSGALRFYELWLESGGIATWRDNSSGISDQIPKAFKRSEALAGITGKLRQPVPADTYNAH